MSNAHLMHDNGHEGLRSSDITKEAGSEINLIACFRPLLLSEKIWSSVNDPLRLEHLGMLNQFHF